MQAVLRMALENMGLQSKKPILIESFSGNIKISQSAIMVNKYYLEREPLDKVVKEIIAAERRFRRLREEEARKRSSHARRALIEAIKEAEKWCPKFLNNLLKEGTMEQLDLFEDDEWEEEEEDEWEEEEWEEEEEEWEDEWEDE